MAPIMQIKKKISNSSVKPMEENLNIFRLGILEITPRKIMTKIPVILMKFRGNILSILMFRSKTIITKILDKIFCFYPNILTILKRFTKL